MPGETKGEKKRAITTRPPYARMLRIHERLKASQYPNCSSLAREIEVVPKTIQRDIEFMRDQLSLPIEYDNRRHGYYYSEPVENLPLVQITEAELVALLIAQKAIEQYRGTPFEEPLKHAFEKLVEQMPDQVALGLDAAAQTVSFRPFAPSVADLRRFQAISDAVLHSRELTFDYRKLDSSRPMRRNVQPYALACIDNQWYVIGHDLLRQAKRTFAVPRMSRVRMTTKTFTRPADFSLQTHLGRSFGVFTSEGSHRIRIRFDAWATRLVRERFWHHSQALKELPDETSELELTLGDFFEVERWILSWGEHAEVLEPLELRKRVANVGRKIARLNG